MEEALRRLVWQRAEGRCEYCQLSQEFIPQTFPIDHIIALQHHGPTRAGNLALSCLDCNLSKAQTSQASTRFGVRSLPSSTRAVMSGDAISSGKARSWSA
jgi:5-methylcytosine-specific restriction endonuclease McrA